MPKITIVGAGNVGSQAAFCAALKKLGDIVLLDVVEGIPQGKALDLLESMPLAGSNVNITGSNDYADSKDSDIAVITAGAARKPGMSRADLTAINSKIIKSVIPKIAQYSPECILIIVTNPLDAMVQLAHKISGFPKQRVLGMAGVLDTARFKTFISQELNAKTNDVEAMVIGSHSNLMVPLVNHCKVKGKAITHLLPKEKIESIVQRVKTGGEEIVKLLKTGSAFFAPGSAIAEMIESILKDKGNVLPCTALLEGEYGINGLFVGVPARLGKKGAEEIIEIELKDEEKLAFEKSVEHIRSLVKNIEMEN